MKQWADIREHGREAKPQEACGVIVRIMEGTKPVRLRNVAHDPVNHFRLDPLPYVRWLQTGQLVGYYHTHPSGPAEFSTADKVIANEVGLPCVLYAVETDEFRTYQPAKEIPALYGRIFFPGVFDCWSFVRDWYRVNWGVELPYVERDFAKMFDGRPDVPRLASEMGLERIATPEPGDLLVFNLRSVTGAPNHFGVLVEPDRFAHQLESKPSGVEPWNSFWRERLVAVYRVPHAYQGQIARRACGRDGAGGLAI